MPTFYAHILPPHFSLTFYALLQRLHLTHHPVRMLSRGKNLYSQDLGRIGQSKIAPYLLMLLFSKLLYVSGTFVSFDLLQSATLLQVLFICFNCFVGKESVI